MRPTDDVTVPVEKRPLYELLLEIRSDPFIPGLMPARIASECSDFIDARETFEDLEENIFVFSRSLKYYQWWEDESFLQQLGLCL